MRQTAIQRSQTQKAQWQRMSIYENALWRQGVQLIAGVDEAGRGPLAGPVAAAAVILPKDAYLPGLNDSKQLSEKRRLELEKQIKAVALSWSCKLVSHQIIDRINILNATKVAMERAILALELCPDYIFMDGNIQLSLNLPQQSIIKGDSLSVSIAAASILAKCTRDRFMIQLDQVYPEYQLAKHKGYPTPLHKQLLRQYGLSPIHRRTFKY